MRRPSLITASATSVLALALGLPAAPALAATSARTVEHTAAGMCVPATFTVAQVRNRPTGVRNESNQTLYVTCSEPGAWQGTGTADDIYLHVGNASAANVTINCTLFTGYPDYGMGTSTSQGTYPKSLIVPPNESDAMNWNSTTLTGSSYKLLNASWSCALPPGAEVKGMYRDYVEDVGA